jgi:DNA-binding transcriptional LysR family regulator
MGRFDELETFVQVVESGSFTAAAERLSVAKSAVSRRIADLEGRLGVQLFRRTTRRLNLTDTGRGFHGRAVRILADLEEAELAVSQAHRTLRGTLRVAAPLTFGVRHLGPAIRDFATRHPEVIFDIDFNDRQVDLIQEGVDVAVRIARLEDSTLVARRLAPVRLAVVASPTFVQHHGKPRSPADLASLDCLAYSLSPEPWVWRYRAPDGSEGSVRIRSRLAANNGDFLCAAAVAGQGVLLSPTFIVYRALADGRLVSLLADHEWSDVAAYAVYPRTRHLSVRVRAFVDFLVERFAGLPYWDRDTSAA